MSSPGCGELTNPLYSEYRDDRFVAAVDLDADDEHFPFAYLVRAVTPGTYRLPAARSRTCIGPAIRARTATGKVTIVPYPRQSE